MYLSIPNLFIIIPKFSLRPGYAIRVFTGSFLPKGTERVVLQEYCKKENSEIIINKLGMSPALISSLTLSLKGNFFISFFEIAYPSIDEVSNDG